MDFKYLVHSGKYSREDLTDTQNAFIDGLEESVNASKELLDLIRDDLDDNESILSKIKLEEISEYVKDFEEYMESVICENIVVFSDNNYAEQEEPVVEEPVKPSRQRPEPNYKYASEQPQGRGNGRYR